MAKIVYLIRHGESVANAAGIYQGQTFDTPLTKQGQKQAEITASIAVELGASAVFFSPLKRAMQTTSIINQNLKLELIADEKLLEINHGSWEGKTVKEFNQKELKLLNAWQNQPTKAKMIGGETISEVNKRWLKFATSLTEGKFIVVTHDVVIRVAVNAAINLNLGSLWQYHLDNCSLTVIDLEAPKLIGLNYNFHLNGLRSDLNRQAL